jgi:hypothetical protein
VVTICTIEKETSRVAESVRLAPCFMLVSGLLFDPEDVGDVPPKRRPNFVGLNDAISQNIEIFIASVLRTSNPTIPYFAHKYYLFFV